MDQIIAFTAFPVLVAVGLVMGCALAITGRWRDGMSLGLSFWVAAGLLGLTVASTWTAIAMAAIIITIRKVVMRAIASTRPGGG